MAGLVCLRCRKFLRVKTNGVALEEGMPHGDDTWGPYKLWQADLYECPSCGFQLVAGFGLKPIAEHYRPGYADTAVKFAPLCRIDDCGGARP